MAELNMSRNWQNKKGLSWINLNLKCEKIAENTFQGVETSQASLCFVPHPVRHIPGKALLSYLCHYEILNINMPSSQKP